MSKANQGPRLRLYGPDGKHGASPKAGFKDYVWYVVWYEQRRQRQRSTGLGLGATAEEKNRALGVFIASSQAGERPVAGPLDPSEMSVAEALAAYGEGHAPHKASGWLIGLAIEQLVKWWGDRPLSAVTKATCQAYARDRKDGIHAVKLQAAKARAVKAGRNPARVEAAPITDSTPRRELAVLGAAINWCVAEGRLIRPVPVWRPDKPQARDRWLTRDEVARLLRAARRLDRSAVYLPLFIRLAIYTGQRKEAILSLQWQHNLAGGYVDLDRGLMDFRKPGSQSDKRRSAIPIPPKLLRALQEARRRTNQYVIEYRKPTAGELAVGIQAVPVMDVKKAFARATQAAGLGDRVTPHVLRHTAISWLVQGGVPIWEVAQFVRLTPDMIEDVYGHQAPDAFANVLRVQRAGKR